MSFEYKKGMEVKEVIKCEEGKYGNRFSCGLSRAKENDKNIFINKKGEKVIDCSQYKRVGDFDENLAYVINDDDKLGFIDLKGNVVIDCKFGDDWYTAGYNSFSCGRALVHKDKELCFIDTSGNVVIKNFEKASPFYQDLAPVEINGKKCFINKAGEIAIDCSKYDSVGYFSDGLAGVRIGRKYGFIDKTGKEVLPLDYDIEEGFGFVDEFEDGLAIVCKNGKYGLIDTNGNEIAECKYKRVGNGVGDVDARHHRETPGGVDLHQGGLARGPEGLVEQQGHALSHDHVRQGPGHLQRPVQPLDEGMILRVRVGEHQDDHKLHDPGQDRGPGRAHHPQPGRAEAAVDQGIIDAAVNDQCDHGESKSDLYRPRAPQCGQQYLGDCKERISKAYDPHIADPFVNNGFIRREDRQDNAWEQAHGDEQDNAEPQSKLHRAGRNLFDGLQLFLSEILASEYHDAFTEG